MIKLKLITILILFSALTSEAQIIKGRISNAKNGESLAGASISLLEVKNGTNTDKNGDFKIKLPNTGKFHLKISFIGFEQQIISFSILDDETKTIDVQLYAKNFMQEQIVVSANKINTNRNQVPMTISVISQSQIEQSSSSNVLPIISSQVPGLFITERGISGFGLSTGSAGKISIRGVGGSETSFPVLVLIDGQPQFMGIFGHPIPDSYSSSDIEKVEIIKGPASILYGTNAMGGVINMITKKNKNDGFSFKGRSMIGSYSTWKLNGSAAYKKNRFSAFSSWNHDETNGHRANSDFKINNGFIKLAYDVNDHFSITANVNRSDFKAYDPGSIYAEDPTIYDNNSFFADITRTSSYLTLTNTFENFEGGLKVYYMNGDHLVSNGAAPDWNSIDENIGLSFYQGLRLFENNLFSVGVDTKRYGGKGSPVMLPLFQNGEFAGMTPSIYNDSWIDISETGVYAIMQHQFNGLTLNAGARLEHHSLFGSEVVPQFGATFNASENTTLKASVAKGFRSPSIRELYLFPPANANLKPEIMWNYELSWVQYFMNKRLCLETNIYLAEGENLITMMPNASPPPTALNINTGHFSHKGIELDTKYRLSDKLSFHCSYSYLNMNSPKIASPEHQFFIGGEYQLSKFSFNLQLQHIGNLYTNINPKTIQDYTLVNTKVNYQLSKNILIFISGENLLNVEYEVQYGYPMPKTIIFSGINLNL